MRLYDVNTPVEWWNDNRKIMNRAVLAFNKCQAELMSAEDACKEIHLVYLELDTKNADYSEDFDKFVSYFRDKGLDMDWYQGF